MLPSIIGFNKLNPFFQTFFRHRDFVTKEKCSSKTLCGAMATAPARPVPVLRDGKKKKLKNSNHSFY